MDGLAGGSHSMAVADEGAKGSRPQQEAQQRVLGKKRRQVEAELQRLERLPAQSHYVLHRKQVARKALELLAKGDQRSQAEADELSSLLNSLSL